MESFDLIVIGSGPAGEKGAAQAAYFGKRVALIERRAELGGAGVNTGTVPSKTLRESALYFSGLRQRGLYGIDYSLREGLTVQGFMHRKDAVVSAERVKIATNLAAHKIELIPGTASFEDAHTVNAVDQYGAPRFLRGEVILIATGSKPHRPPEIPFDDKSIFDSDSILAMDRIPKSMIVVGGGVIGCEYASIFTAWALPSRWWMAATGCLPFLDAEISERLRAHLANLGPDVPLPGAGRRVTERTATGIRMTLSSGKIVEAETALFAAGRRGAVEGLGSRKGGPRNQSARQHRCERSLPDRRAATSTPPATSSVFPRSRRRRWSRGAWRCATRSVFPTSSGSRRSFRWEFIRFRKFPPWAKPRNPARKRKSNMKWAARNTRTTRAARLSETLPGILKLIFRPDNKQLLGVQILGESATELIHLGMAVLEAGGTIDTFIELVFNFPTLSEMYKYAAYDGLGNLAGHKLREG